MELSKNFLLIDKPVGWTSFDVVGYIRSKIRKTLCHPFVALRAGSERSEGSLVDLRDSSAPPAGAQNDKTVATKLKNIKVGHAGTLDPFATGLLIVGVGREATRRLDEFKGMAKTYVATVRLGATSDTQDSTGTITHNPPLRGAEGDVRSPHGESPTSPGPVAGHPPQGGSYETPPTREQVETVVQSFFGKQLQTPPMYSAKSIGGQRLYTLARQGIEIAREPNEIEILDIKILKYSWPMFEIEVTCSAGTYIRSVAHDIGAKLLVGAYCDQLRRTRIGPYSVNAAQTLEQLDLSAITL